MKRSTVAFLLLALLLARPTESNPEPVVAAAAVSLAALASRLNVAVTVLQALGSILNLAEKELVSLLQAQSVSLSQPHIGALWVTQLTGRWGSYSGRLLSAYFHPSRPHTASTKGKLGLKRSSAAAGKWAVSLQTRDLWGNKAYYNTL